MENMYSIVPIVIGGLLGVFTDLYIIGKINDKKPKISIINILLIILTAILTPLSFFLTDNFIRLFAMLFVNILIYKKIYDLTLPGSALSVLFTKLVIIIAEILFISIAGYTFRVGTNQLHTMFVGKLIGNVSIYFIAILITYIKPLTNFMKKILKWYGGKRKFKLILFLIMISVTTWIIAYINITKQFDGVTYLMSIVLVCSLAIVTLTMIKDRMESYNNNLQYERLNRYVHTYESLLDELRINQHENKNRLVAIRGMVKPTNKKLLAYINSILDDYPIVKHTWVIKLKNISDGGLKGLFYSKMMQMEQLEIHFFLDVSETIKNNKAVEEMPVEHYKNLCTVIGVFLDNAIEATKDLQNPEVFVELFYMDEKLQFVITNNYNGTIDQTSLDKPGFTSKGKGHGYGLSLVNRIVEQNKVYTQLTEVTDKYFIQYFKIDLHK